MRKTVFLLLALTASQLLGAQALPLLYTPTDPRSAALGGAGVALDADAWAEDVNLAAAALAPQTFAIGAAYTRWAPKPAADNRFSAGGWYRHNSWAVGFTAKGAYAPAYNRVSPQGETKTPFQPRDLGVSAGLAWSPLPGFALSVDARLVSSVLDEGVSGNTFCATVGLAYNSRHFQAGLTAGNLGGKLMYGNSSASLPLLIRGGGAYVHDFFTVTAEVDYLDQAGVMACAGAEFRPTGFIALRAGYHYGPADRGMPSFGSCGIGLAFEGLAIDVSVLFASPTLGGSLCAGLYYAF